MSDNEPARIAKAKQGTYQPPKRTWLAVWTGNGERVDFVWQGYAHDGPTPECRILAADEDAAWAILARRLGWDEEDTATYQEDGRICICDISALETAE